jgi:hypothetical protein
VHTLAVESESPIAEIVIDAHQILPDVNRRNNTWRADDAGSPGR